LPLHYWHIACKELFGRTDLIEAESHVQMPKKVIYQQQWHLERPMATPKQAFAFTARPAPAAVRPRAGNQFTDLVDRCLPVKVCKKGTWIATQGDRLDGLFIVQEGRVLLTRLSSSGREAIIGFLEPGEFFGEVPLLDGDVASFNAFALETTVLLTIRKSEFNALLEDPSACRALMGVLARRCNDAWTQIEILGNSLIEDKVRIMLEWLGRRIGVRTTEGIHLRMSQGQLAKMVGSSRESLNRQLSVLKSEGVIKIKGKYPKISMLILPSEKPSSL
jgi:CRP-like cAMP-binding protein